MPEINESVVIHKLNVDLSEKPIKQKRKFCVLDRQAVIDEEVVTLLKVDLICKIQYPEWLANVVMVKKSNGK